MATGAHGNGRGLVLGADVTGFLTVAEVVHAQGLVQPPADGRPGGPCQPLT